MQTQRIASKLVSLGLHSHGVVIVHSESVGIEEQLHNVFFRSIVKPLLLSESDDHIGSTGLVVLLPIRCLTVSRAILGGLACHTLFERLPDVGLCLVARSTYVGGIGIGHAACTRYGAQGEAR